MFHSVYIFGNSRLLGSFFLPAHPFSPVCNAVSGSVVSTSISGQVQGLRSLAEPQIGTLQVVDLANLSRCSWLAGRKACGAWTGTVEAFSSSLYQHVRTLYAKEMCCSTSLSLTGERVD